VGLAEGNDSNVDDVVICFNNGTEAACCTFMYASVAGGTTCMPLGSAAFSRGANLPKTGANIGLEFDETDGGNMQNAEGAAMLADETGSNF